MRIRVPGPDEKHRNLLLTEFETASYNEVRKVALPRIKKQWPDWWDKIKKDFKYEELNNG